jgi:hypothetical protein
MKENLLKVEEERNYFKLFIIFSENYEDRIES